jgi:hypothetical protein
MKAIHLVGEMGGLLFSYLDNRGRIAPSLIGLVAAIVARRHP